MVVIVEACGFLSYIVRYVDQYVPYWFDPNFNFKRVAQKRESIFQLKLTLEGS